MLVKFTFFSFLIVFLFSSEDLGLRRLLFLLLTSSLTMLIRISATALSIFPSAHEAYGIEVISLGVFFCAPSIFNAC
jgi:hypothetical protein